MKRLSIISILFAVIVLNGSFTPAPVVKRQPPAELSGKITMSGAFALYPMAVKWGEEFKKLHPKVEFDIQGGGAGKGMTDALTNTVKLGMVSREITPEEAKKGAFGYAVCKDAVVPTMNISNPYYAKIYETGVTKQEFYNIYMGRTITTWGELLQNGSKEKIKVYTRSDAAGAADAWAKFMGGSSKKQDDLEGVGVYGDPGLAQAVVADKLGIGYNNIGFAYDTKTHKPVEGIAIIPIDINANGKLDPEENFYSSKDKVVMAILADIYPSPPARQLYFVSNGKVTDPLVKEFLKWVLTDGQKYVAEAGYVELAQDILDQQINKLK